MLEYYFYCIIYRLQRHVRACAVLVRVRKCFSLKVDIARDDRSCNALRSPNASKMLEYCFYFIIYHLQSVLGLALY